MTGPIIPIADCQEVKPNTNNGYRKEVRKGYRTYAHRWAYCDANSIHPSDIEGKLVLHSCDNRVCVNPDHLRLGTHRDNVSDMDKRGRRNQVNLVGEEHGMSKYPYSLVLKIQEEYTGHHGQQKYLANKYGVGHTWVNKVVKGKVRTHGK